MRLVDVDELGVGRGNKDVLPAAYCAGWNGLLGLIDNAPTVDAVPVVHGHKVDDGGFYARCSQCDGVLPLCANYCPNCGAKMDGGDNDARVGSNDF